MESFVTLLDPASSPQLDLNPRRACSKAAIPRLLNLDTIAGRSQRDVHYLGGAFVGHIARPLRLVDSFQR